MTTSFPGAVASGSYNSDHEDGNDPIEEHETIATLPLIPGSQIPSGALKFRFSSPKPQATQPTQVLDTPVMVSRTPETQSIVQVTASSPVPESRPTPAAPTVKPSLSRPGILASAMAPTGTFFQRPYGVQAPPPPATVIDLSDDDPPISHGSSSEDELTRSRSNIRPSTFANGGRSQVNRVQDSPILSATKFRSITSQFAYNGDSQDGKQEVPRKRYGDDLTSAYAGSSRPQKQIRQTAPSRARPVPADIRLEDIPDYEVRQKVDRMSFIYPNKTIALLQSALAAKKGNFEDAICYVVELEEEEDRAKEKAAAVHDKQKDDLRAEAPKSIAPKPRQPIAKRQVQAPNRTIQQKWSSTQATAKSPPSLTHTSRVQEPPKPRRRLVQGRRNPSSPVAPSPQRAKAGQRAVSVHSDSASDSGVSSGPDEEDDERVQGGLLQFLNSCSVEDLVDLSNHGEDVAKVILSKRPFRNLDAVRQVAMDTAATAGNAKGKRKSQKRPIGDRVIDVCLEMWSGYEAVDELVNRCEALGKPLAAEMEKWGFNVFGAAKEGGELDMFNLDDDGSEAGKYRDSGIGTPSSSPPAIDVDITDEIKSRRPRKTVSFLKQPAIMADDFVLKDYQVVGLNWLNLLWSKNLSCILADDMGLGKTCQVISFLAHLYETGVPGRHLIIVPGSTLENWLREFQRFCPKLVVEPYYGSQDERAEQRVRFEENLDSINVFVTTYDTAWKPRDNQFLRKVLRPVVCVFDEGHALKNSSSKRYRELMRIPASFRLLLTGTPLQNNLQELSSLLAFMLPDLFRERQEDLAYIFKHKAKTSDSDHSALLSAQRIRRARSMMTPFVLRRKKHQVLQHMPEKVRRVEYCDLHPSQKDMYAQQLAKGQQALLDRAAGKSNTNSTNIMMSLRKAALHPLLFRSIYSDAKIRKMSRACLKEEKLHDRDAAAVLEDMELMSDYGLHRLCQEYPKTLSNYELQRDEWMNSGKVEKLTELLKKFTANGDRTLIFSQFTSVMDILEAVLETLEIQFFRLDGQTPIPTRQDMLDEFYKDESIPVFMLSTKAGGSGINLACANKVIIFDSSFNPQEDIQAENRAHRVGQTREVEVIRLVTRGTIEEQIHALGNSKLALDDRVAGEGVTKEEVEQAEKEGMGLVERMMLDELRSQKQGEQGAEGEGKDKGRGEPKDLKESYLDGLKAAGLDVGA